MQTTNSVSEQGYVYSEMVMRLSAGEDPVQPKVRVAQRLNMVIAVNPPTFELLLVASSSPV
jgi:hypothetical protein